MAVDFFPSLPFLASTTVCAYNGISPLQSKRERECTINTSLSFSLPLLPLPSLFLLFGYGKIACTTVSVIAFSVLLVLFFRGLSELYVQSHYDDQKLFFPFGGDG